MDTSKRFAGDFFARGATVIAQDELIGGESDGFAEDGGRDAFGEGGGGCFGGLRCGAFEQSLAELIDPGVVHLASAGGAIEEFVLFEEFWQQGPSFVA